MVQVTLSIHSDTATTIGIYGNQFELLQGLQGLTDDIATGLCMSASQHPAILSSTIDTAQGTNTGTGTQINVASQTGGTHEEPVSIRWGEFFEGEKVPGKGMKRKKEKDRDQG
jgi:hypothetical protein